MSDGINMDRFLWFDGQIQAGRFPNARTLAEHFEVSNRTAQRAIERFRDRFDAPLEYDSDRHGYYYTDPAFQIPLMQVHQQEILALLVAGNLLSHAAGGFISRAVGKFGKRLLTRTEEIGLSEKRLAEAFSAYWHGFAPASAETFRRCADALLKNHLLSFDYRSPQPLREAARRTIEPHHLRHYMGSWMLIAFCLDRKDWRTFALSRISGLKIEKETFVPRSKEEWRSHVEGGFGIFQGGRLIPIRLHFTPTVAPWIRERHWHPAQGIEELADGGLILSFPVADFREVKLHILQYGAEVEVVEPAELRDEIAAEIDRMKVLYGP
ncbi:MAG: WYL domain-containing protein [Desulfuromonadaceae bacterium]|nr:WYL domain-containing protein [Desulfuromonadaceae bacterium]